MAWPRSGAIREDSTDAALAKHSWLRSWTLANDGVLVIRVSVGCGMVAVKSLVVDIVGALVNVGRVTGEYY
jgi:hypothetical protein